MIKSCLVASAITIGLAGYALAQETTPGSPMGNAPVTQEAPKAAMPGNTMGAPMRQHATHHVVHHHVVHHVHHMNQQARHNRSATHAAPGPAPGQAGQQP